MPAAPPIEARGVHKRFRDRVALAGVDFTVQAGELVGLIGPNGAGKSTLLRTLIGLVHRDRGEVAVLGRDPAAAALAIRRHCSYLPGETSVYATMTGQAFLDFALSFYPERDLARLQQLAAGFELPLHKPVRAYSAGMKQKLAILAALTPRVDLYLLDEPDRALDASVRFFLRDVLARMRQQGATIVLSSHHLSEVETLADRLEFVIGGRHTDPARLAAARAQLRARLRVRLRPGTPLPAAARLLAQDPDGTQVLGTDGDPLRLLQQLPTEAVLAAEVGNVRLEELYKLLLAGGDREVPA